MIIETISITTRQQYVIGDSVFEAQFEVIGRNFHRISGTEVFVRKADDREREAFHAVPDFILHMQKACFQ